MSKTIGKYLREATSAAAQRALVPWLRSEISKVFDVEI